MFYVRETAPDIFEEIPSSISVITFGGINYTRSQWRFYSDQELLAIGIYRVPPTPIDQDQRKIADTFGMVNGVLTHFPITEPIEFEIKRARVKTSIETKYAQVMQAGYQHNFGTEEQPNWQILQIRGVEDEKNWLVLKDACRDVIAMGGGDAPMPIPFRTASNELIVKTCNEAVVVLSELRAWGSYVLTMTWALKDALAAVPENDDVALQAIKDLIESGIEDETIGLYGWPQHQAAE